MLRADGRRRGLVWTGVVTLGLLLAGGASAARAADTLVVEDTAVTAEQQGAQMAANVKVANIGRQQVVLVDVPISSDCFARLPQKVVEPLQATSLVVNFEGDCFGDPPHSLRLQLAAEKPGLAVPAVTVDPPATPASDWAPAELGALIAALLFVATMIWGWRWHARARAALKDHELPREVEYVHVQEVVGKRIEALGGAELMWRRLDPLTYGWWKGSVGNLEAGWSLQSSFVSNLTLGTTALVALVTSVDAATAVLGSEPKAALRVMATVGLVSAVLIGTANLALKVVGPHLTDVTPFGLTLSTSLAVGAAVLQTVTVGAAAAGLVDPGDVLPRLVTWVLTVLITVGLVTYGLRSIKGWLMAGPPTSVPAIPAEALVAWKADSDWDKLLVDQRIRTAFNQWLDFRSLPKVPVHHAHPPHTVGLAPPTLTETAATRSLQNPIRQRALI